MVFACLRRARSPDLDRAGEELGADLAATDELNVELDDAMDEDLAGRSKNLKEISTKITKSMKINPVLAPPTWHARCCVLDHGPGSKGYPLFRFGTGREGGWETSTSG